MNAGNEAEPEPTSLDEDVDWMTYSHNELYAMVNQGMDLGAVTGVAGGWHTLGTSLQELGGDLRRILDLSAASWSGVAADQARRGLSKLVDWSQETGVAAWRVAAGLEAEVANAAAAKHSMPPPMPQLVNPGPVQLSGGGTGGTIASAAEPLASTPIGSPSRTDMAAVPPAQVYRSSEPKTAFLVAQDHQSIATEQVQRHRQAAEVMRRFQQDSREVYGDVPSFTSPTNPTTLSTTEHDPTDPTRRPTVPLGSTSATGADPTVAAHPQPGTPTGGRDGGGVPATGAPSSGASSSGAGDSRYARTPGASVDARQPAAAGGQSVAAAGQSGAAGAQSARGGGMMPMSGAGARKESDRERAPSHLLESDDDLFGGLPKVAPPVLGVDGPDA